jgi:hypothetical protein
MASKSGGTGSTVSVGTAYSAPGGSGKGIITNGKQSSGKYGGTNAGKGGNAGPKMKKGRSRGR